MGYSFNPFKKPISEIHGDDLIVLKDLYEGWFVDYKRECQNVKETAKSLSAFANQYGGWLLIGIDEGSDGSMKAESFPGVCQEDVPQLLVRIRDAATTHVSPAVFYEQSVISGPCESIGLSEGRAIIVVGIPQGTNPPFLHSSGRIYRRQGDSSVPKHETDRAVLDLLWNRGDAVRRRLIEFICDYTEPASRDHIAQCHIYLLSDPHFESNSVGLSYPDFKQIMTDGVSRPIGIAFDNLFPAADGYLARQVGNYSPLGSMITFRWWHNGNVRITVPLNRLRFDRFRQPTDELLRRFLTACRTDDFDQLWIADLRQWLAALMATIGKFYILRSHLGLAKPACGYNGVQGD